MKKLDKIKEKNIMAVCLDTVKSIELTAVTFKYKLLTFSEVNYAHNRYYKNQR